MFNETDLRFERLQIKDTQLKMGVRGLGTGPGNGAREQTPGVWILGGIIGIRVGVFRISEACGAVPLSYCS